MTTEHRPDAADDLVVEIASNDGYLLQFYKSAGVQVLGVEPAANVAEVARRERGIETVSEFFDARLADELTAIQRSISAARLLLDESRDESGERDIRLQAASGTLSLTESRLAQVRSAVCSSIS